jgi:hypothetical protein
LLAFRIARLKVVQQEKAKANDDVGRQQRGSASDDDNADRQGDRHGNQGGARKGKDVRDDNSYRSHERQTNKWLTRRVREFHPSAFRLSGLGKASRNRGRRSAEILKIRENAQRPTLNTERSTV